MFESLRGPKYKGWAGRIAPLSAHLLVVAQWTERSPAKAEAGGSTPPVETYKPTPLVRPLPWYGREPGAKPGVGSMSRKSQVRSLGCESGRAGRDTQATLHLHPSVR
jgi:hypothetical protein